MSGRLKITIIKRCGALLSVVGFRPKMDPQAAVDKLRLVDEWEKDHVSADSPIGLSYSI
jgi:hypothetical protein